jgi:hypothetical protein
MSRPLYHLSYVGAVPSARFERALLAASRPRLLPVGLRGPYAPGPGFEPSSPHPECGVLPARRPGKAAGGPLPAGPDHAAPCSAAGEERGRPRSPVIVRADDGVRTRDLHHGKVTRYRLRYVRVTENQGRAGLCGEEGTRTPDLRRATPTLYQLSYDPMVRDREAESRSRPGGFLPDRPVRAPAGGLSHAIRCGVENQRRRRPRPGRKAGVTGLEPAAFGFGDRCSTS